MGHVAHQSGGIGGLGLGDLQRGGIAQPHQEAASLAEHVRLGGGDGQAGLLGGRHVHIRPAGPDDLDDLHDGLHGSRLFRVGAGRVGLGPLLEHEEVAGPVVKLRLFATRGFPPTQAGLRGLRPCARLRFGPSALLTTAPLFFVGQGLPDLLGDKGHKGMQELKGLGEHVEQHLLGAHLGVLVLTLEAGLGQLDIPVAVIAPDEVVHLLRSHAQLVAVHVLGHLCNEGVELGENPLVLQLQPVGQGAAVDGQVHHQEAAGVPDLIGKVAHGLAPVGEKAHVIARRIAGDQVEAQGVRAVLLGHLQGVDAVAQRFGHFAPLVVPDQTVDEHGVEGRLAGVLAAGEDHAGHPEENDVVAGDQHVGGIEILEILGLLGPAQSGEGPQGGGEPGIQHVLLLVDVVGMAVLALGGVGLGHGHFTAVVAGPGGDAVAPPQLAGDAPVAHVFHPVGVGLGEAVGDELHLAVVDHPQGFLGQGFHLHEPLGGDQGLHVVVAAVTGAHVVRVVLHLHQVALLFQIGHNGLSGLVAVHAGVPAVALHHLAVVVQHADGLQVVAQAHLKVVGVVGRGHLHAAGAEFHIHVLVGHDGHFPAHQGQNAGLAHDVLIPLVVGVDGHAGVAQHGLRPGSGHDHIAALLPLDGVADVPQVAGLVLVFHLCVRQGGDAVGAPVDDAGALVDQALVIEGHEHVAHGLGQALVHGEAGAAPVAGHTQLLLLLHDSRAVLGLPVPHPLQELLPAQVVAGQALLGAQLLLHLDLGGDSGVVGTGHP